METPFFRFNIIKIKKCVQGFDWLRPWRRAGKKGSLFTSGTFNAVLQNMRFKKAKEKK